MGSDTETLLDLFAIAPDLAMVVCDANGRIYGGSLPVNEILRQDIAGLIGHSLFELFSSSERLVLPTFRHFVLAARDGVEIRLKSTFPNALVARVREVPGDEVFYAVSFEAMKPSGEVGLPASSHADELVSVAEEVSEFGCFDWDMTVDVLEWTDGLLRIFGVDRESFGRNGEAFFSRVHPDDKDAIREAMAEATINGGHFQCAERIFRSDGDVRWLETRGRLSVDEVGQPRQLMGVCRDITDNVRNADALERQVDMLGQLAEVAAKILSGHRPEADWKPLLEKLGLITGADVFNHCVQYDGRPLLAASHEGTEATWDSSSLMPHLKMLNGECAQGGVEMHLSVDELASHSVGKNLHEKGLRCYYGIPLLSNCEFIGVLAFASTEKSEFDEADRHLLKLVAQVVGAARARKLVEQLRESEQLRFRQISDHARTVIWEADTQKLQLTFVSDSCHELTGYRADEWIEPGFFELLLHPDDLETSVRFCRDVVTAKTSGRCEYRLITKDGRVVWVEDVMQVILRDGELVGLRGMLVDITERRSLERQLLQSQKMEAMGSLTSGVAHDFNNLLTVILSSCELMQLMPLVGRQEALRELVEAIQDAGLRASQLTDQLLLFSRSSTRQPRTVDLNVAVEESRQFLNRILGSGTQCSVELQPDLPGVRIDPTHLQQILMNLVVNARDAMSDGGKLLIQTNLLTEGESGAKNRMVVLKVSDTGVGMLNVVRSQIFDPFFTTKPVGTGTGLGLSVVYGIVHSAGGHIEVDSEVGVGSEFRVYLPAVTGGGIGEVEPVAEVPAAFATTENILVVEDEPSVMQIVVKSLEQAGYNVIGMSDPIAAIQFVLDSDLPIDLLVTDVNMPTLSGPELVQAIQGELEEPPFPFLYLSGHDQRILETRHGISANAENFLQKPFRIETLIRKTRELIAV